MCTYVYSNKKRHKLPTQHLRTGHTQMNADCVQCTVRNGALYVTEGLNFQRVKIHQIPKIIIEHKVLSATFGHTSYMKR
jgi:hypothetical protein